MSHLSCACVQYWFEELRTICRRSFGAISPAGFSSAPQEAAQAHCRIYAGLGWAFSWVSCLLSPMAIRVSTLPINLLVIALRAFNFCPFQKLSDARTSFVQCAFERKSGMLMLFLLRLLFPVSRSASVVSKAYSALLCADSGARTKWYDTSNHQSVSALMLTHNAREPVLVVCSVVPISCTTQRNVLGS